MKKTYGEKIFFFLGIIGLIISYFLPVKILENYLGNLRPMGFATLIVCPICGILGLIFAIKNKKPIFIVLNILLIPVFFILMFLYNFIIVP